MKVLVTGGAGYIGSHTVIEFVKHHSVVVVDSLVNSHRKSIERVRQITGAPIPFYKIDLRNKKRLAKVFHDHEFDAIVHFAGLKSVGESINNPLGYYSNNIGSTQSLLELAQEFGVKKFIFSSSATVYGNPKKNPVKETTRVGVGITNPYGRTKFIIEQVLTDFAVAHPEFELTILRYFNPIGAHESGLIGEDPNGTPNNLLPYISQVAVGKLKQLQVYGNDYPTPDGTGIRDFIHVGDLAKGHLAALNNAKPGFHAYNLGTGRGVSVLELVDAFSKVSGKKIPYTIVERRPGDIAVSFANVDKAWRELGWRAEKTLEEACLDSWRWQSKNPDGFLSR